VKKIAWSTSTPLLKKVHGTTLFDGDKLVEKGQDFRRSIVIRVFLLFKQIIYIFCFAQKIDAKFLTLALFC